MRDLFDDFLEELRRREAAARGEDPDAGAPKRARSVGPDPDDDAPDDKDDDASDDDERRPPPPHEASPPRRPRLVVDDDDRGGGRHFGWIAFGLILFGLIVFLSVGLDIWTDALWYQSVGFDSVFWTRIGAQAGLFVITALVTTGSCSATCGWPVD